MRFKDKMKKKIAIIGSRCFVCYELLEMQVFGKIEISEISEIISGGEKGADKLAEKFAEKYGIPIKLHLPDWEKYGNSAGMVRNRNIINDADIVFAFWDGKSKGTKKSIEIAKKSGKELYVLNVI